MEGNKVGLKYSRTEIQQDWNTIRMEQILQVPLCLAVEDLWRVKIRAKLGEDAQYWYFHRKVVIILGS